MTAKLFREAAARLSVETLQCALWIPLAEVANIESGIALAKEHLGKIAPGKRDVRVDAVRVVHYPEAWVMWHATAPAPLPDDIRECCAVLRDELGFLSGADWSFHHQDVVVAATWQVLDYLGRLDDERTDQ